MTSPPIDTSAKDFRPALRREFDSYLQGQKGRFKAEECLKIDLHCHDHNSDKPDELWGRILGLPETWLKTKQLVETLRDNDCDVITVTNHNNASSCWDLQERGEDVLVAAEFTCHFPEYELFVHVLTYGFTREDELELNRLRGNIYEFLRYVHRHDIVVVLPHPLYFYTRSEERIEMELFEKFAVMFQRFEVLNGQRDQWQSVLTLNWVQSLTPEKIRGYARKHDLDPADFGVDPMRAKALTGGSDCHMGIFSGKCGSYLQVPNLAERRQTTPVSVLALEALREGRVIPFGSVGESEKLNIALLDYSSQVATRIEDPGLLRLVFHRGEMSDKIACFVVGNLLLEMQKHKNTQKFFKFIHKALHGKKPGKLVEWKVRKNYRFCIDELNRIADSRLQSQQRFVNTVNESIDVLFTELSRLVLQRIRKCLDDNPHKMKLRLNTEELTRSIEIPLQVSALVFGDKRRRDDMSGINFSQILDLLTFPLLVGTVLLGTHMGSTRLLYQNRRFLNDFADALERNRHPRRALYLTDTLLDRNGVSSSLSGKLADVQRRDLPIDFLICHADAEPQPHLHVLRPLDSFRLEEFGGQELRIPDLMHISRIFYEGGYDRVVCSTEGPMAVVALALKHMFNVPCYFFMHTDWLDFIAHNTDLNLHERDRVRRLLRFFYQQFSGVFVLNREHRDWLVGHQMGLDEERVMMTAHHVEQPVVRLARVAKDELLDGIDRDTPTLIYAGRLSREKGLDELPGIVQRVRQRIPGVQMVICGTGPYQQELQRRMPSAIFTGWVDRYRLRQLYTSLDLMVFPSRFDTFGNVVLEAFCNGMPVVAYDCKGPRDIIQHGVNGFLAQDAEEIGDIIVDYFANELQQQAMRDNAVRRSEEYNATAIMDRFVRDLGLGEPPVLDEIVEQRQAG